MKKTIVKGLLMFFLATGIAQASHAQRIYVKVRPVAPVVVRTVAPSPRHVWVEGEWVWVNNAYTWHAGYWAEPPHPREVWVAGHWRRAYGGWNWVPGHWRRG